MHKSRVLISYMRTYNFLYLRIIVCIYINLSMYGMS